MVNKSKIVGENQLSLTFAYYGSLVNEITVMLSNLNNKKDWKIAGRQLYNSGLVPSEKFCEKITSEIKKRFKDIKESIPDLDSIITIARSNVSYISKAEIYYVYLYNSNKLFSKMMNFLGDIYGNSKESPIITRKDIKNLLTRYLEREKKKISPKSADNWIGRFLSLLKEINILIPQQKNSYIMNFGGITLESWTFFILYAYFKGYNPLEGYFIEAFQIKEEHIPKLIERSNTKKWMKCSLEEDSNKNKYLKVSTEYNSLEEWLNELK